MFTKYFFLSSEPTRLSLLMTLINLKNEDELPEDLMTYQMIGVAEGMNANFLIGCINVS